MPGARPPVAAKLDFGQSYTQWVREVLLAIAAEPDAAVLFESTIREPTDLLARLVRRIFDAGVPDRWESTFARGNRYVIEAVAARYGIGPGQVICTTGATAGLAMALKTFVSPGDHVIVETPVFDLLPGLAAEAGAEVSSIRRRAPDFDVDPAELARLVGPRTRAVMLTQVHNPSGAVLSDRRLSELAEVCGRAGAVLLLDEVYGDFAGQRVAARLSPHIVSVGSLTKVQGLFSLKCGWIIAAAAKAQRILATHDGDLRISKLAHAVAAHVMADMTPFDAHWRGVLDETRPVAEAHAAAMQRLELLDGPLPKQGCMYFPRVVGVDDTRALCDWLWRERRVIVAPGEFFDCPGHVRVGFGGSAESLDAGLTRLAEGLEAWRAR